jgi:hypothetical protein
MLIALSIATAGCEEHPRTVSHHYVDGAWSLAQGAMRNAPLLIVIEGQPFVGTSASTESRIAAIMKEAITWTETAAFTTEPAQAVSQTLRIVITFNPLERTDAHAQCTRQSRGGEPLPEGRVRIIATFCDAATVLVTVSGRVGPVADLDDPRFAALVRQVTLDMLSPGETRR